MLQVPNTCQPHCGEEVPLYLSNILHLECFSCHLFYWYYAVKKLGLLLEIANEV